MKVSKLGRTCIPGKALDNDLRRLIIDKTIAVEGERRTKYMPVCRPRSVESLGITVFMLNNIWKRLFCDEYTVSAYFKGGSVEGKSATNC